MKTANYLPFIVSVFVFVGSSFVCFSQTESASEGNQPLRTQFQEMLDKSETYTDYKVIRRTNLDQFVRAMQDSLNTNRAEINQLKGTIATQKEEINSLRGRISVLEGQLAESEKLRDSLSFLGLNINKATYHTIVWIIIAALVVFGIFMYSSFYRSNKITAKSKKEYESLKTEFEEHKKKSHERQIKMGRELQTERNKVEELKAKLKSKTPGKPLSPPS